LSCDQGVVQPPELRRFRILFLLAIASSMTAWSVDFLAPSMPNVTRDLHTSAEAVKTTIVLFLVGYGIGPFMWGALADRVGRRRIMVIGLGSYGLASVGCLLSPGILEFSLFRVAQGIGAASGAVVARAVLRDIYGPTGTTKAISSMFLIMVWVPITAPVVGGMMGSWLDWRLIFLVMALIAGATVLGSLLWLTETSPAGSAPAPLKPKPLAWTEVLVNPVFLRHTLPNMFCIAAMLMFLSNYSYVTEGLHGFSARQNGYVLAAFNATIAAGVYLVRFSVPKIGVEKSISTGLGMALAGWVFLWMVMLLTERTLAPVLPCVALACLGTGMVITLTVGQALTPFADAAGTASALFILVQYTGASAINFLMAQQTEVAPVQLAAVLALCSGLALLASKRISAARAA